MQGQQSQQHHLSCRLGACRSQRHAPLGGAAGPQHAHHLRTPLKGAAGPCEPFATTVVACPAESIGAYVDGAVNIFSTAPTAALNCRPPSSWPRVRGRQGNQQAHTLTSCSRAAGRAVALVAWRVVGAGPGERGTHPTLMLDVDGVCGHQCASNHTLPRSPCAQCLLTGRQPSERRGPRSRRPARHSGPGSGPPSAGTCNRTSPTS